MVSFCDWTCWRVPVLLRTAIMSMLDRLKNAVLGNPVEREYEIGKHVASAGPGLQWRVHQGTKKTTRQVSLAGEVALGSSAASPESNIPRGHERHIAIEIFD